MESLDIKRKELLSKIKEDFTNFDEGELLEFTGFAVPNIHYSLSHEKKEKAIKYCTESLINKMLDNKEKYRISNDIDNIRVGYARIEDYINEDNKYYIKVYTSIFFYDDVDNNEIIDCNYDKYWNDIWVLTYEGNIGKEIINKCPACGASMEYNKSKHMFTCNFCRNSIYYSQINWKLTDIEVNGINYK